MIRIFSLLPGLVLPFTLAQAEEKRGDALIEGCWKLVSGKGFKRDETNLRFIIGGQEIWVKYDKNTKKTTSVAGGSYRLEGTRFSIGFDYASDDNAYILKHPWEFTYKCTGNHLSISADHWRKNETQEWERVK